MRVVQILGASMTTERTWPGYTNMATFFITDLGLTRNGLVFLFQMVFDRVSDTSLLTRID